MPSERPGELHLYSISSSLPKETATTNYKCLTCPTSPEARPKAQVAHQKHDHTKYTSIFENMYEETGTTSVPPTQEMGKKKKKSKIFGQNKELIVAREDEGAIVGSLP